MLDGFHQHNKGNQVCLVATGFMMHTALKVVDEISTDGQYLGLIDIFNLTNFSDSKFLAIIANYSVIISLEEGFSGRGGLDAMLTEFIMKNDLNIKVIGIGVNPGYSFELGTRQELHEKVGIGFQSVLKKIRSVLSKK